MKSKEIIDLKKIRKENFEKHYNDSFESEIVKKTESIWNQFSNKQIFIYQILLFSFLFTILIKGDYVAQLLGNWFTTIYNIINFVYFSLIFYLFCFIHYPYKNILIKLFYPKLSNEYKQNKESINHFFTNEKNINNVVACMNFCKKEFKIRFKYDNDPMRDFGDDILKAFKEKNTKKVIKIYFQIKYEIDYFINEQNKTNEEKYLIETV